MIRGIKASWSLLIQATICALVSCWITITFRIVCVCKATRLNVQILPWHKLKWVFSISNIMDYKFSLKLVLPLDDDVQIYMMIKPIFGCFVCLCVCMVVCLCDCVCDLKQTKRKTKQMYSFALERSKQAIPVRLFVALNYGIDANEKAPSHKANQHLKSASGIVLAKFRAYNQTNLCSRCAWSLWILGNDYGE